MKRTISMRSALSDVSLLGSVLAGNSWRAWRTLLIAAMGEPLTADERKLFATLTGREREPLERVEELAAVVGRRGGKSRAMSTFAAYIAGLCDHSGVLVPGERGVLLCVAPDQRQATITLDFCNAAFEASPLMKQLIANRTSDTLELTNNIAVEVRAASFRRLRGPTYIGVIADEAAFWYADEFSSNTDVEILNSVRPGLATTGGPLVIASSPYAKRGVLFDAWRRHHGPQGDPLILVAQGTSRDFNPTLRQSVVDRAMERDAASASAEYLAQFRTDIEAFVSREAVEACVVSSRFELPPGPGLHLGFCDPSGGSVDSMSIAIAKREQDGRAVLCALREMRPPFSPTNVVAEFSLLLKSYGIHVVTGDHYGGIWPTEAFAKCGIRYELSDKTKSDIFLNTLPLLNSGRVELLDNARLVAQFCGLERRVSRGGRDSIDHGPGGHDDVCNAAAGALLLASGPAPMRIPMELLDRIQAMPRYRGQGSGQRVTPEQIFGERKAQQMAKMANRRQYGW